MKLTNAEKEVRQFFFESWVVIVILNILKDAFQPAQIKMFQSSATAIVDGFLVDLFCLFQRDVMSSEHLITLLQASQHFAVFLHQPFKFITGGAKELLIFILIQ